MISNIAELGNNTNYGSNIGIYALICTENNTCYIGQSRSLKIRRINHFSLLRRNKHQNRHLQRIFNKYGEAHLKFIILENCEIECLNSLEGKWVNKVTEDILVNMGFTEYCRHTLPEEREKISANMKSLWGTEDYRKMMCGKRNEFYSKPENRIKTTKHLRAISEQQANTIRELYVEGKRICQIMKKLNLTEAVVYNVVHGNNYCIGENINKSLIQKCLDELKIRPKNYKKSDDA